MGTLLLIQPLVTTVALYLVLLPASVAQEIEGSTPSALTSDTSSPKNVPRCPADLTPVYAPAPHYPTLDQARPYLRGTAYAHTMVVGAVKVEYFVLESGSVADVEIIESNYDLVGQKNYPPGYFDDFLPMNVIPTLSTWRYEPVTEPCLATFTIRFQFDENLSVDDT